MRMNLDPTVPKVVIIALLIFGEGIAIPLYTVTTQGRMPTEFEAIGFVCSAFVQLATYLLTFLQTGKTEPEKPTEP